MNDINTNNGERDLLDILIVPVKHSRKIVFTTIAVTVIACLILILMPNKYTATSRILPPQQNMTLSAQVMDSLGGGFTPGSTGSGGSIGGMAAGLLGLKSPGDLYVGILTSNTVTDAIIQRFNLKELYKSKFIEDARKTLSKNAEIGTNKKDGLIGIEVTDKDPQLAAAIANAYIEELDKLLQQLAMKEAKDRLSFLEKERVQTNQNLFNAEEALRTFSERNSVLQIDTQTKSMLEYIANLRATIDAKEVQIQVLRKQATPFNYDVVRLETELKGLKDKLTSTEKQWDLALHSDVCLPSSKVPSLGLEYSRLYREAKFQEGLYQLFTKLTEIARLDMVKDVAVIQVVDRATPPEKKSKPMRLLISLLVAFVTFIFMVFWAFISEFWQHATAQADQIKRLETLHYYFQPWTKIPRRFWAKLRKKE
ncbi:MAG: hypothetical protein C4567_17030 [Deltaproteobacteria bacterium]|nr:MAG: hypothetical protein C4567_17030 [Deltaproteobacteria bacterium]